MGREYMGYVGDACKNGMTGEEVSYMLSEIYNKANTKFGKRVLKMFSKGIGKAKKHTLNNQLQASQQQINPQMPQIEVPQMQKTIGVMRQQ